MKEENGPFHFEFEVKIYTCPASSFSVLSNVTISLLYTLLAQKTVIPLTSSTPLSHISYFPSSRRVITGIIYTLLVYLSFITQI